MTSHDVVAKIRTILRTKKVGHTGTLDPMVTGVLPVVIGKATRLSDYFMSVPKEYMAVGVLGKKTDTQDAEGEVIATCREEDLFRIQKEDLLQALSSFRGRIRQIPPDHSCVKIGGKKLIDCVHKGDPIPQKKPRNVTIYQIELLDFSTPEYTCKLLCSKGTYVRTVCNDLGERLGVYGHMKRLVRTGSGGFRLSEAVPISEVSASSIIGLNEAAKRISHMPVIYVSPSEHNRYRMENGIRFDLSKCGKVVFPPETSENREYLVYLGDDFCGIADETMNLVKCILPAECNQPSDR